MCFLKDHATIDNEIKIDVGYTKAAYSAMHEALPSAGKRYIGRRLGHERSITGGTVPENVRRTENFSFVLYNLLP